jgi:hemoglobin
MKMWKCVLALAAAISFIPVASAANETKSLYDRLGGKPAIQAVASDLVDRILADPRVNKWFAHAASSPEHTNAYKTNLADFLCRSTGGPCEYTGPDMVAAHKGRRITNEAFNAVAEDLVATLDKFKVPGKEKDEVLKLVGGLKPAIVQQ